MKVLIGYRGKERNLLHEVLEHVHAFKAEVLLVTVLVGDECKDQEKIFETEQHLEYAEKFFKEKGVSCKASLLARGDSAGENLVSFANENIVDLIMIGVKKRSKVGKLIFGSTSQNVILSSSCPVTTFKIG
jgi:nucleotide-binding universal stress UspA family protein